ncbi:MAG: hypothetical protein QM755_06345 [Luteolibacter sp.]
MKKFLPYVLLACIGLSIPTALTSCSGKSAAESAAQSSLDATKDYCELLESIKDKDSAKAAIEKMDGIADKFAKIAEKAKSAGDTKVDPAVAAKLQEDMKPITERMTKAVTTAMPIIGADPELAKAFQEKSMAMATKMAEAAK